MYKSVQSREKTSKMIKFVKKTIEQRKITESDLVVDFVYSSQNTQLGLVTKLNLIISQFKKSVCATFRLKTKRLHY